MEAHEVLGVPKDAPEEQFRRAYKALARKWHPDRQLDNSEEATAKFVEINKAYKTMARNLRRARRAAEGAASATNTPESSVSGSPPATPESFSSSLPEEPTRLPNPHHLTSSTKLRAPFSFALLPRR
ncbi:hypothetical protein NLJ89_g11924 [Agrocybe chaxingu]|uniref:J domain-containing protein n=1 Tax=Agrocybe chaxingu TaxID=84603 RepID=A0A9W8JP43_9AGAR|nr:hypothetical protein NLJ89_g11924 [Agrocybe chaxingu]